MYRLAWLLLLLLASPSPAAERRYSISDFERIRLVGAARIVVETGRATTVRASGDREALDDLLIEVADRTLVVQPTGGRVVTQEKPATRPVTIYITVPRISGARLNGSGAITLADFGGLQSDIALTGSGQISVARLKSDNLAVRLSGSGTLTLAGSAQKVDANVKGSGSLVAAKLDAADVKLTAASSGTVSMAARRTAGVIATGSGTVVIAGSPACTVQNIGTGVVTCGNER
jgi:Putative auto-transporter adhesin, head GIN domain